ncbi:MAG TPA: phage tail sheath C-terminal domain-containing protein [Xanthobacteraceae bacterium]|jgi:hypothetical protein|nr:phage tail sheath C-terminal domain-containing protein [Xanthobacteraceae bacterium]
MPIVRTPGVYVTELPAFPSTIVGVATAIPAFIGYTETAAMNGKAVALQPIKITSLAEYQAVFGGAFRPVYDIVKAAPGASFDFTTMMFDGTGFAASNYALVRNTGGPAPLAGSQGPVSPSVAMPAFNLYDSMRLFYANGGGTCYVVSVGNYTAAGTIGVGALLNGLDAIAKQAGPTMLVVPDAVHLPQSGAVNGMPTSSDFQKLIRAMLTQAGTLQDRVALLDIYGTEAVDPKKPKTGSLDNDIDAVVRNFHVDVDIGDAFISYGAAYFPFLDTTVIAPQEVTYLNFSPAPSGAGVGLAALLTDQAAYTYGDPQHLGPSQNKNPKFLKIKAMIDAMSTTTDRSTPAGLAAIATLEQNLVNGIPSSAGPFSLLQQIETMVCARMSLLPPSGAMAGVCTHADAAQGVWNAPANIPLYSVDAPSVKLSDQQQSQINIPLDGKAVNAIREFIGRGPVVWGARTLDGNSSDWRYIQVRRTVIYVEQSIKIALNQYVFAANDANTWTTVVASVSQFLQTLWSQGGLMGDKASDAFTVTCGLGSTMTAQDILDGYMIVQVALQMIHPAEFIELTFKQTMTGTS